MSDYRVLQYIRAQKPLKSKPSIRNTFRDENIEDSLT